MKKGMTFTPSLEGIHKEDNMRGQQQYTSQSKDSVRIIRVCHECGKQFWQFIPMSAFMGPGELPDAVEEKLCQWCKQPEGVTVQ